MPSRFDAALARADERQLRTYGEDSILRHPSGEFEDTPVVIVFSERDTAEPPNNMSAGKGQYSTAWATLVSLPVENPAGCQVLVGSDTYWVRNATADGGGGVVMLLHKVRA